MSDRISHECGLAVVRLLKPLDWYREHYGDSLWGLRRLFLLMEKQHNRGQDGAGIGAVRFDMPAGERYLARLRSAKRNPIERLFDTVMKPLRNLSMEKIDAISGLELKRRMPHLGELMLGHLRYGTHGGRTITACHPYLRKNIVASRNLAVAGNFNLTNSKLLFEELTEYGLDPVGDSDTQVVLEKIGYYLDREHEHLAATMGPGSFRSLEGRELADTVSAELDLVRVLRNAADRFDGGYVFASIVGNGDLLVCRDPAGIRPAFIYRDDAVVSVASERAALVTAFNVDPDAIEELPPAHALEVKRNGTIRIEPFIDPLPVRKCTFERIYFSRGNDRDIYRERKRLGANLAERVLEAIDWNIDDTVFGFIPNTAETAFAGLREEINAVLRRRNGEELWKRIEAGTVTREDVDRLIRTRARSEKVAHKDQRLRTFITHDAARRDLVSHVYDVTRGTITEGDTLVVVDDSIVRGTTLRESIITMLARLSPRRIVVVSSAPPIMYPDCYGIDMSQLGRFIAFEAAISLIRDAGEAELLDEVEARCLEQADLPPERMKNHVAAIYGRFPLETLSARIADLIRSDRLEWSGEIEMVYQDLHGLHEAMPDHTGDWYFTGDYPTPGGYRVLNTAYLNWRKHDESRAY
ncbi:MAG: amidophosphoribosyltransferase [Phycisphaerae bacterium]|nr:amidophosphoribosyltransferase [Phycisphaerae bacterium]OUX02997.1 MAG: amidophosphoribosyltransferase [Phycisphaeraceae bacterium TMED231]